MENRLIYGTMGLGGGWDKKTIDADAINEAEEAINAALSIGIDTIDLANIYQFGRSESVVGEVLKRNKKLRKKLILQSKVGIQLDPKDPWKNQYNFSYEHIIQEVYQILDRLQIDKLDRLLLHRYDPIFNPEELYQAIEKLSEENLVDSFGVSNMSHNQMQLIESVIEKPIKINQFEMSLKKLDWLESSVLFNHKGFNNSDFPVGTLEYCERKKVEVQSWGSLAQGMFSGKPLKSPVKENVLKTKAIVERLAEEKNVSQEGIVLAFLLKPPFNIRPIIGTTNPERIKKTGDALTVKLSRKEWYQLFIASRGEILP
jgi:predicted oxidoreductase